MYLIEYICSKLINLNILFKVFNLVFILWKTKIIKLRWYERLLCQISQFQYEVKEGKNNNKDQTQ